MNKPIRVLQIVWTLSQVSGVAQVVLNWHKHLDTSKVQFDYIYFSQKRNLAKEEEITKMGGNVFYLPYKNPLESWRKLKKIFKERQYTTIHSHILQLPILIFPLAKKYGVKNIIQHMHNPKMSDKKLPALRNYLLIHSVWHLITHKMACSYESGKKCYGKDFKVVNNGINAEKFVFNPAVRAEKRKELGLENNFVLGHVGRFFPQKNQIFLLEIFEKVLKKCSSARLVLVGVGTLKNKIEQIIKEKNLQDKVLLLGLRSDIPELLQAFDCYVFPSLFEGLGISAIEAQASGLPCILADTLPKEAFICNYKKMSLGDAGKWAQAVLSFAKDFKRIDTYEQIKNAGFSALEVAKQMQSFYQEIEEHV